jgi:hypothetical protein
MEISVIEKRKLISDKDKQLRERYPMASMGSKYTLWNSGLRDGFVSEELYYEAQKFYGNLWHYCGD